MFGRDGEELIIILHETKMKFTFYYFVPWL
jgi:hypothetical protein